jgi:hypothetical protein
MLHYIEADRKDVDKPSSVFVIIEAHQLGTCLLASARISHPAIGELLKGGFTHVLYLHVLYEFENTHHILAEEYYEIF